MLNVFVNRLFEKISSLKHVLLFCIKIKFLNYDPYFHFLKLSVMQTAFSSKMASMCDVLLIKKKYEIYMALFRVNRMKIKPF